jgi:hypothetical protein
VNHLPQTPNYWGQYETALQQCLHGLLHEISSIDGLHEQGEVLLEARSAVQEVLLGWQRQHLDQVALERLQSLRPALTPSAVVLLGACLELIRTWSLEIEDQYRRDTTSSDAAEGFLV